MPRGVHQDPELAGPGQIGITAQSGEHRQPNGRLGPETVDQDNGPLTRLVWSDWIDASTVGKPVEPEHGQPIIALYRPAGEPLAQSECLILGLAQANLVSAQAILLDRAKRSETIQHRCVTSPRIHHPRE